MIDNSLLKNIENKELVEKLKKTGYDQLIKILLEDESVYTKKGRLNKSSACRKLGWKPKQLEDALFACKELILEDVEDY